MPRAGDAGQPLGTGEPRDPATVRSRDEEQRLCDERPRDGERPRPAPEASLDEGPVQRTGRRRAAEPLSAERPGGIPAIAADERPRRATTRPVAGERPVAGPTTVRARHGERGEALASGYLERLGWHILARRVRVGRDEIDLVAVEPGSSRTLVFVEVRSHATSRFGTPEESVDRRKIARLYRAATALDSRGVLPDGTPLPRLRRRIDLVAVDDAPSLGPGLGGPIIRHVRAVEPM